MSGLEVIDLTAEPNSEDVEVNEVQFPSYVGLYSLLGAFGLTCVWASV